MGGVLYRLAQRALPGTGGVRPRLAGRYEAVAEPVEHFGETIGESFKTRVDAASPLPPHRPTGTPRRLPQAADAPYRRNVAQREAPEGPALPPISPGQQQNVAARSPLFQAAQIQPGSPVFPLSLAAAPARATAPEYASPRPAPSADNAPPAPPAALPTPKAPFEPLGLLLPELRTAIDAAIATSPHAAPIVSEVMARETPPDLHISIGRIEVRGDRPEPRKPPRPPARERAKMMSLEDYLAKGRGR